MGSLKNGLPVKRDSSFQRLSSSRSDRNSFSQRPRSRFARFILFKKIDYLQWVCTVAMFFFFVVLFQMLLPGSITEKSGDLLRQSREVVDGDLTFLKEMGVLDFGEDIKFEPSKILAKFHKEFREANRSYGVRFGLKKPKLAMVFTDLLIDPQQIMMDTLAAALREIGYEIEPFQPTAAPVPTPLAGWMSNPPTVAHPAVSGGAIGLGGPSMQLNIARDNYM